MSQFVVKRFISDGNAVNIDLGFVPEYCEVTINNLTGQTPNTYRWTKCLEDESTALYGVLETGSSGATSVLTTAATGIVEFDALYRGCFLPDPAGGAEQKFGVPTEFSTATDYSSGYSARTATAIGSLVWPTTRNGYVYELSTATGAGTTEPTWGTTPGGTTTDGGSNIWICREANTGTRGAQGITLGATTQTDGHINIVRAWKADHYENVGDAADHGASDCI